MSDLAPRPRSTTEIVDAAFQLYRRSPMQLILAAALIYVPWLIVRLIITSSIGVGGMGAAAVPTSPAGWLAYLILLVGSVVIYGLVDAAILRIASELYVGRELDATEALRSVVGRLGWYVVVGLLRAIAIGLAALLLVLPALYVYARLAVVIPVAVLEPDTGGSPFARSGALSKGLKWHILLTMLLVMIIYLVLTGGVTWAVALTGSNVLIQVVSTVMVIVLYPIVGLTTTLLYYDLRIRREGYDIELMAAMNASPDAFTGPAPA